MYIVIYQYIDFDTGGTTLRMTNLLRFDDKSQKINVLCDFFCVLYDKKKTRKRRFFVSFRYQIVTTFQNSKSDNNYAYRSLIYN